MVSSSFFSFHCNDHLSVVLFPNIQTRIEKWHEVLDIGCGWGILAIEVVKRTGCKYTGITLSEKQLKYAEDKVKEAGLEGNIKLLLCDYRQLPKTNQYDRIISVEMVEHVGKEYIEEFYRCCDQLLKKDGLFVLQVMLKCKVLALGFDDKFMRTWEYYFDYCAAGFKTGTLLDYQVVFSRADNFATLGDPYKGFPSAYSFMDT
ncbi:hypothetical protein Gorai_005636 [Gossypium raimondii]|uniref:Methyltransferase domain-containing protein n=1 Tax=Gossypium raimondii TaxID=29730 RepID=A0A7J8QDT4_GOSRA|nr:hypothetical protein [Gossypium raimondii]